MARRYADTYSFLFTDIEGSTRRWEAGAVDMESALRRHDALMRAAIEAHSGHVFKTVGDAFCAVFGSPVDAVLAAVESQQALVLAQEADGDPLRVRMAVHSGVAEARDDDFFGPTVNRVARILSAAHGGQILLSSTVEEMVVHALPAGVRLMPLGEHRLKDLDRPVRIAQVAAEGLVGEFPPLRTLDSCPNNLPVQLTPFYGRLEDIERAREAIDRAPVVTVVGAGGVGKTRTALQVAAEALDVFPDGVWLVALAPVEDPGALDPTVAEVLGARESHGTTPRSSLLAFLRPRELLLVIDNCEHLVDAVADLVHAVASEAPGVRVLATSQSALGLPGEQIVPLAPLPLPADRRLPPAGALLEFAAVGLFVGRATAVHPGFALNDGNAGAVVGICRRLDGLPLAIELAAARVRMLQPAQILARLDDSLALLAGPARAGVPERHQTLRAAIAWSYGLLDDAERDLLDRLSVFRGGWSLEAAEAVGASGEAEAADVLDRLFQLVDKSLVVVSAEGDEARFHLLETIRAFAADRLGDGDRAAEAAERHARWYADLAVEAATNLTGPDESAWIHRLAVEHENLRAVLARLARRGADAAELGLRTATSLATYWTRQGRLSEARRWLETFLAADRGASTGQRSSALAALGEVVFRQGDYGMAREHLEACLDLQRSLDDARGEAQTLRSLGNIADEQGDYDGAVAYYERSLAHWSALGDAWGQAAVGNNLGLVARKRGDLTEARRQLEASLAQFRVLGTDWAVGLTQFNLGDVAADEEDWAKAGEHYGESLRLARQLDDLEGVVYALVGLSDVARMSGKLDAARASLEECLPLVEELGARLHMAEWLEARAALALAEGSGLSGTSLFGAADAVRAELSAPLPARRRDALAASLDAMRAALGEGAVESAWRAGQLLSWKDATALALRLATDAAG